MLIALLVPLALAGIVCMAMLLRAAFRQRAVPKGEAVVLGAIVSFFDTLGIGSFAPTTAWFKFRKLVPDRLIPQTMSSARASSSICPTWAERRRCGQRVSTSPA